MIYRGFWIICRVCLFPIRLPDAAPFLRPDYRRTPPILFACPACAHLRQYQGIDFRIVQFRIPDPFREKRAVLYKVEVPCGIPRCESIAGIYAVGAASISVAALLKLWKYWLIHGRCQGHRFKPLPYRTWTVSNATDMHSWVPITKTEPPP
jgi:hypothetical protein